MSAQPVLVTVTIDGQELQAPKGQGLVETAAAAGIEIPVFCYEPRLGPPVGACRMCLCEVEGLPKLQAACTLTATDGLVLKTAADEREGVRGPERDPRVHPAQPPARLPRLRQGRRVPAPGPDLPLRAGLHPDALPEAHLRQADPDLAVDRARPGALHPLLPLHALLRERVRGRPARRGQSGRLVGDRDFRGRAVPRALLRQRRRALPRRRADVDDLPLPRAAVGDPERPDRLRALPGRLQRLGDDARGEGRAHPLPQPPGDPRGLALRQGPVRLRPPARRGPHPGAARPRAPARLRGGDARGGARRRRGRPPRGRGLGRGRVLGRRDRRAGDRPRPDRPRGARVRHRPPPGRLGRRPRRLPRPPLRDPGRPTSASCSATTP